MIRIGMVLVPCECGETHAFHPAIYFRILKLEKFEGWVASCPNGKGPLFLGLPAGCGIIIRVGETMKRAVSLDMRIRPTSPPKAWWSHSGPTFPHSVHLAAVAITCPFCGDVSQYAFGVEPPPNGKWCANCGRRIMWTWKIIGRGPALYVTTKFHSTEKLAEVMGHAITSD